MICIHMKYSCNKKEHLKELVCSCSWYPFEITPDGRPIFNMNGLPVRVESPPVKRESPS